ncbi:MAG: hypothetical protein ACK55Z_27945 [bacterium]|jgi:hypothetical protein
MDLGRNKKEKLKQPRDIENIDDVDHEDSEFPEEMFSVNAAIQAPRINTFK